MSIYDILISNSESIGTTSSSPFTGSPTFDLIPFHVSANQRPLLGTYVIVEADEVNKFHYGRIIDGTEENPRADPSTLQMSAAYQVGNKDARPGDRSPHVTRVMTIEILGEIHVSNREQVEILEPSTLPQTGKPVYPIQVNNVPYLLGLPESDKGLHIGFVRSGTSEADFILPMETLARHIAVLGKTGVGKSYAVGVMIEELVAKSIPIISFDVLGDFREATKTLNGVNLTGGEEFKVPYSLVGTGEFLNFIPNLTKDQEEIVATAYGRIFSQAVGELGNLVFDVAQQALEAEIEQVGRDFVQPKVAERAISKVKATFRRTSLLSTGIGGWAEYLAQTSILNIFVGQLGQSERNLLVGATARILQTLRRQNLIPPFVMILDEAHFFLPSGGATSPSTSVIRELVRTARHDAIGIMLISQSPSSMDKQTLLTCNTRLVFALDRDDLSAVSGTMSDVPDPVLKRIPKMSKGTAIVTSGADMMRHSATVLIRRRTTPEGAPTPKLAEEVAEWRKNHP